MDCKKVVENIRKELKSYIVDNKLKSLVVGISGGIDSAVCVALAKPVCDEIGIKIIGRSYPIESNKDDELTRAQMVGHSFCHDFKETDMTGVYEFFRSVLETDESVCEDIVQKKICRGNIKARIRMVSLYNLAYIHKGMVLSTDNYSELMLSFFTLHGDVGDYGMIQNIFKTEVYALAIYIADNELINDTDKVALRSCIDAIPTDGLGITNSDLDQLGVESYDEVDRILKRYLETGVYEEGCPVIDRHIRTKFKRNNPLNLKREVVIKGAI